MNLYNSLSGQVEPFQPLNNTVTVYVCGITPYDTTHLGHAFTYATFDVLIRYLESRGHVVRYAQNVTDIDDDILRKASEGGDDWQALGERWTRHFMHDLKALNVRPPDAYPRATAYIDGILETVQALLDHGVAYAAGGNVYFAVSAWDEFGKLSGLPYAEMLATANERGNFPNDPHKRDPLDFVLWQAHKAGEPAWDSPWGAGRPGWHIECSTMATRLLGETIDIHGGGSDLLFPHHECEIAQSECATGQQPFVRVWMHTAMVHHEGEKMSKSLGNLIMARDLLQEVSPDALRIYMASHHYRTPWAYDASDLQRSAALAAQLAEAAAVASGSGDALVVEDHKAAFVAAMDNDLNTPAALAALTALADRILEDSGRHVDAAQATLRQLGAILGLRLDNAGPEARVVTGWDAYLHEFGE